MGKILKEAPVVSEAVILKQHREWLTIQQRLKNLAFTRISTGGIRFSSKGRDTFVKNPDQVGVSDFIIWMKGGPVLCLEIKSKKGKLSDSQQLFSQKISDMGHMYLVSTDLDFTINTLASISKAR